MHSFPLIIIQPVAQPFLRFILCQVSSLHNWHTQLVPLSVFSLWNTLCYHRHLQQQNCTSQSVSHQNPISRSWFQASAHVIFLLTKIHTLNTTRSLEMVRTLLWFTAGLCPNRKSTKPTSLHPDCVKMPYRVFCLIQSRTIYLFIFRFQHRTLEDIQGHHQSRT